MTTAPPPRATARSIPSRTPAATGNDAPRRLLAFGAVALPTGWALLSVPLVVDLPVEPFVLGTLLLGLVLPAVLLTRRDPRASARALLHDTVRLPRPAWLLVPAALLVPAGTAAVGALLGVGTALSGSFVVGLALANVLSSVIVVNLWEEMAWAGFVQRRAADRWGYVGGSVVTALLFTGIHLPLAFYGTHGLGDIAYNVAVMIVSAIGLRLLIGAFDVWGRGSILTLALIHATFNATGDLLDPGHAWVRYAVTLGLGLAAALVVRGRSAR
jgi:membrane protease YdiL (CAAX protease family)